MLGRKFQHTDRGLKNINLHRLSAGVLNQLFISKEFPTENHDYCTIAKHK